MGLKRVLRSSSLKELLFKGAPLKIKAVGPPSDYPESSWKVFWLVLTLLGSDLDDLWRK